MKTLPTLYSRTSLGSVQQWTMIIDGASYYTKYGQVGGAEITTKPYTAIITNEGRANERDADDQALFEAQQIWQRKTESGYFPDIKDIDNDFWTEPMLAKNYKDRREEVLKYLKAGGRVFVQPKMDGARNVQSDNGPFSRNGKPWITVPHIIDVLAPVFAAAPELETDGELYTHKLKNDFDKIMSLVKKKKPTKDDLAESAEKVQYWIYDIIDPTLTFIKRQEKLTKLLADNLADGAIDNVIVIVPTFECFSEADLDNYHVKFLDQGYEGSMIRFNEPYEKKRSSYLLKRKDFDDAEYKILDVIEGNGNKVGMVGAMLMDNPGYETFRSNIKGNHKFLKDIWKNKESYVGKWATVKYFGLGSHNSPRFPYIIKFREGKGVD